MPVSSTTPAWEAMNLAELQDALSLAQRSEIHRLQFASPTLNVVRIHKNGRWEWIDRKDELSIPSCRALHRRALLRLSPMKVRAARKRGGRWVGESYTAYGVELSDAGQRIADMFQSAVEIRGTNPGLLN